MTMPAAHLFRVILPVTDIARAAAFWAAVFEAAGTRISPGRHYFQCGGTILACYHPEPRVREERGGASDCIARDTHIRRAEPK